MKGRSDGFWLALVCGGFCVGSCLLCLAGSSGPIGFLLTLGAAGACAVIVSGRTSVLRRYALIPGGLAFVMLVSTAVGVSSRARSAEIAEQQAVAARAQAEQQAVVARAQAAAQAARADELRAGAPALLAQAQATIATAQTALSEHRYADAVAASQQASASLSETAAITPAAAGIGEALAQSETIRISAAAFSQVAAQIDAAHAAATEEPGSDVLAWAGRLETLAANLRAQSPEAHAEFGVALDDAADALDQRRQRFHRQIDRAERTEAERLARVVVCGAEAPDLSYVRVSLEMALRPSAHDPDSIDVPYDGCTAPVLTRDDCWVSECGARGRNAFGALVLSYYRVSMGAGNRFLGAEPIRHR